MVEIWISAPINVLHQSLTQKRASPSATASGLRPHLSLSGRCRFLFVQALHSTCPGQLVVILLGFPALSLLSSCHLPLTATTATRQLDFLVTWPFQTTHTILPIDIPATLLKRLSASYCLPLHFLSRRFLHPCTKAYLRSSRRTSLSLLSHLFCGGPTKWLWRHQSSTIQTSIAYLVDFALHGQARICSRQKTFPCLLVRIRSRNPSTVTLR